jgi:hypothetical protein
VTVWEACLFPHYSHLSANFARNSEFSGRCAGLVSSWLCPEPRDFLEAWLASKSLEQWRSLSEMQRAVRRPTDTAAGTRPAA